MTQNIRLTPAQKKFISLFDTYTRRGTEPRQYQNLRDEWKIQHRTMNWCQRSGLLKQQGVTPDGSPTFVVNPEKRRELGLADRIFKTKILRPRKRLTANDSYNPW